MEVLAAICPLLAFFKTKALGIDDLLAYCYTTCLISHNLQTLPQEASYLCWHSRRTLAVQYT